MGFFLRFLFKNLRGSRFLVFIAVALTFGLVASDIVVALPLKFIPDKLQRNINPPSFLDGLTGNHSQMGVIIFSVVLLVVFSLISAVLGYIELYLAAVIAQNLTAKLRKQLFEHLQRLTLDWHGKQKKGDIVQRVTGNVSDIEKFVADGLVDLLSGILTILGVTIVMFTTNVSFTLLSFVIIPALALVVFSYTSSIKAAAKKSSRAAGEVADVAVEDVGAITVLKAFSLEEREAARFDRYVNKNREAGLRAGFLQAQFTPLVTVLVAAATAVILGVGAYVAGGNAFSFLFITIAKGSIGIGTVLLFITLLGKLFQPMKDLSKLTNIATSAAAGAERIQEVLDQAPELLESSTPFYGPSQLKGAITFENVVFGYSPEKLILKGINLSISPGKKVALVGLSGGGKTTLVKLIPRFYEVTQGRVTIDGMDSRMYPLAVLRRNVSMVLQESVLFEGTVLENLKIGRPEATYEEVIAAAQQAHIHDTIMNWPDGYGTLVRNQGKNFSGGQRQRLAIARAILSRAPILILDEPTASLDVEAEAEVMRALDKLVVGRTVLMISHRLSTLGKVDEIIVLKDGLIVEQGTYQALKHKGGVFAGLLKEQNRYNVDYVGESIVAPKREIPQMAVVASLPGQRQVPPPPRPEIRPGFTPPPVYAHPAPPPQPIQPPYAGPQAPQRGSGFAHPPARPHLARLAFEIDGKIVGEQPLPTDKPLLTVGRLSTNDVRVPSSRVSRLHARLRWEQGAWVIEDAESLNGISYQGNRVDRHVLFNGDRLTLAPRVRLFYREG